MKKILLATSALVAMSSVAVAGGMVTPAPMAADTGFTVVATGEATIFGFYNSTAAGTYGLGATAEGTLKASKTLDNGADVYAKLGWDNGGSLTAIVGYKAAIGEFKAGAQEAEDHGVEIPGPADLPEVPDAGIFAFDTIADYKAYTAVGTAPLTAANIAVTYKSPEFGGFNLGLGVNGAGAIDVALAGSIDASGVVIKLGAGYAGSSTFAAVATNAAKGGMSIAVNGFTLGADVKYTLAGVVSYNAGLGYVTGPYSFGVHYSGTGTAAGSVGAGAKYSEGDLTLAAEGNYTVTGGAFTAKAGGTYKMGDTTLGLNVGYASVGSLVSAAAGVDYKLNSHVTLGAGVGYDGAAFGAAAGLKVKF